MDDARIALMALDVARNESGTTLADGVRSVFGAVAFPNMTTATPTKRAVQHGRDRLLTLPEVCDYLGISRSTFYDWRQAHKAPPCVILPNAQIRVRESLLIEWISAHLETE